MVTSAGRGWVLVTIDPERCLGSGMCQALSPARFTWDEEGMHATATPVLLTDDLVQAAECCPGEAISVLSASDDHTRRREHEPLQP